MPNGAITCVVPLVAGKPIASNSPLGGVLRITVTRSEEGEEDPLNQRRNRKGATARTATAAPKARSAQRNRLIVEHVRMVVSLIEGRRVSRRQVLEMLARVLRQHTMCRSRQIDQTVAWLNKHPP